MLMPVVVAWSKFSMITNTASVDSDLYPSQSFLVEAYFLGRHWVGKDRRVTGSQLSLVLGDSILLSFAHRPVSY